MNAQGFLAVFEREPQGVARMYAADRVPVQRVEEPANLPDAARVPGGRYDDGPAYIGQRCDGVR